MTRDNQRPVVIQRQAARDLAYDRLRQILNLPLSQPLALTTELGDTALVLSQRLCEWVGKAPALEEDMALANTGLDLIGQARMWLSYAGEVEGLGRDEDRLAYLRDAQGFRNLLLVEQPNGSYAETLARQYLFDSWHFLLLDTLKRDFASVRHVKPPASRKESSELYVLATDFRAAPQPRRQS